MIFERLELRNFKSHVNTSIDFNHGITLIIGENGAGKSSIFEAITFALFKESEVNNIDLVRTNKGVTDQIEMEVKLTFFANNQHYRVERKITKKNDKLKPPAAKLIKITETREETVASGVREVDREIERILNMNSKTFLNAIHIRQGEISKLIDDKPAARKKLIGQLLRLDDLEKAYNNMPNLTKDLELKRGRLEGRIVKEDELNESLEEANNEHKNVLENVETLKVEMEVLKKESELKEAEKSKLDELKNKLTALKLNLKHESDNAKKLAESHEEIAKRLAQIEEDEKQMEELKPLVDKLQAFTDFKETLLKYRNLEKDESIKTQAIEKIRGFKEVLTTEKDAHDKYAEMKTEIDNLTEEHTKLSAEIKVGDELAANRDSTQKEIDKYTKSLDDFYAKSEQSLEDFDFDDDIRNITLDEFESVIEKLVSEIKAVIEELEGKIEEYKSETVVCKQEIKTSNKPLLEIKKVENKCPTCQSDITPDMKDKLINTYELTISESQKRITELKDLIDNLEKEKANKEKEQTTLESVRNDINKNKLIPDQIEKLSNDLKASDEKIAELDAKRESLKTLSESIESKTSEAKGLEANYNAYSDAETLLANEGDEAEIAKDLDSILKEKNALEQTLTELSKVDSGLKLDIADDELAKHIDDLTKKSAEYNRLEGSVKTKAEYEANLEQKNQEIVTKNEEIEGIKKTIESCQYDENVHEEVIKAAAELAGKVNDMTAQIAVGENMIVTYKKQIDDFNAQIEENKKYLSEFNAVSDYIDLLEDFREFYSKNGVQKDLRSQSKPLIQSYTWQFFDKFNFNYSNLILGDEYDISIYGPEGEIKLDMVSGGEKIAIALSLRLAITQAMSKGNIETILLDEPTIHLDVYRKQELINVLESMSVIPQMIIVTHDSELEKAADTIIKVEKEDGISKVEQ